MILTERELGIAPGIAVPEREREPPDAFTLQKQASSTGRELSIT